MAPSAFSPDGAPAAPASPTAVVAEPPTADVDPDQLANGFTVYLELLPAPWLVVKDWYVWLPLLVLFIKLTSWFPKVRASGGMILAIVFCFVLPLWLFAFSTWLRIQGILAAREAKTKVVVSISFAADRGRDDWWLWYRGRVTGPHSSQLLRSALAQGDFPTQTPICALDTQQWEELGTLTTIRTALNDLKKVQPAMSGAGAPARSRDAV